MRLEITPSNEDKGLPQEQAITVAGALVVGLSLTHFVVGIPSGAGDWLVLAAAAIISPSIGYKLAVRQIDTVLGISIFIFVTILLIASAI